jgi:hypothetical protein
MKRSAGELHSLTRLCVLTFRFESYRDLVAAAALGISEDSLLAGLALEDAEEAPAPKAAIGFRYEDGGVVMVAADGPGPVQFDDNDGEITRASII